MKRSNEENGVKLYNEMQEMWWKCKHDNNACIDGVKGYEHVDVAANYRKMQMLEELMDMIEA